MDEDLEILRSSNIKGIKSPKKKKLFCNKVGALHRCLQNPRTFFLIPNAQGNKFGRKGSYRWASGILTIVDWKLEPSLVYNHPFGGIIGIQIKWDISWVVIFNVYSMLRMRLWKEILKIDIQGEHIRQD